MELDLGRLNPMALENLREAEENHDIQIDASDGVAVGTDAETAQEIISVLRTEERQFSQAGDYEAAKWVKEARIALDDALYEVQKPNADTRDENGGEE